jgi:endo-1,4-beta-xylanase
VNEVIDIHGSGRVDALRDTPWLRLAGDDYIELAFRTARDADPTALLAYNEYGIELEPPEHEEKRAMVLLLLRRLKARQAPIDALGIQSHLGPVTRGSYGDGLRKFMATVRDMDMQVFITEMDVDDKSMPPQVVLRDEMVAATYNAYLSSVLTEPAITCVLTWGITDRYSWLNNMPQANRDDKLLSRPLLFDEEFRVKPAFEAVRRCFDARKVTASRRVGPMVTPPDPYSPFTDQPYLPSAPPGQPQTR